MQSNLVFHSYYLSNHVRRPDVVFLLYYGRLFFKPKFANMKKGITILFVVLFLPMVDALATSHHVADHFVYDDFLDIESIELVVTKTPDFSIDLEVALALNFKEEYRTNSLNGQSNQKIDIVRNKGPTKNLFTYNSRKHYSIQPFGLAC